VPTTPVEVSDSIFGVEYNEALVHQVVVGLHGRGTRRHQGTEEPFGVSGGGAKPWRQKGTGRARAGTIRSPIWRSRWRDLRGPPRNYAQKVNRKMYRAGMRSILVRAGRQERLLVVEWQLEAPKTKRSSLAKLGELSVASALIVVEATMILLPRGAQPAERRGGATAASRSGQPGRIWSRGDAPRRRLKSGRGALA
jgi:large subunit ribosomal protein L4